jgi:hypothetical protein
MNIAMPLPAAGVIVLPLFFSLSILADEPQLKQRPPLPANGASGYRVAQGQRIAVKFLNTVTTRGSEGDRLFMQTTFPVTAANRIVIPARSYIDAEITAIGRADRSKGRAELHVRLGQLTLPSGVQRPLRGEADVSHPTGIIAAAFTMRGPDVMLVPGTTAEIVLVDALLFGAEEIETKRR